MLSLLRRRLRMRTAAARWPAQAPVLVDRGRPVFDAGRCDLNGACAAACPVAAITVGASFSLDRARCISCARCIEACPTGALVPALVLDGPATSRELLRDPLPPGIRAREVAERARRVLGRSVHVRHLDAGSCNGCDWEISATTNAVHDIQRFGIDFVASPRHADLLLVTGTMTRNLQIAARRTYDAMAEPRLVVAVGACAASGSPYPAGYASGHGTADALPVDVFVPGCPPRPEAIIEGILLAVGRIAARA
ncbi:MAG TPA: NADH-quinone oxidoreductase subunit NuoB [Candidatus Limnocylindria bacterium]|nr:NADH-quinone oxidoreductase subunit NuoB [Candidatus Limnocylindria bacterium]